MSESSNQEPSNGKQSDDFEAMRKEMDSLKIQSAVLERLLNNQDQKSSRNINFALAAIAIIVGLNIWYSGESASDLRGWIMTFQNEFDRRISQTESNLVGRWEETVANVDTATWRAQGVRFQLLANTAVQESTMIRFVYGTKAVVCFVKGRDFGNARDAVEGFLKSE